MRRKKDRRSEVRVRVSVRGTDRDREGNTRCEHLENREQVRACG